MLGSCTSRLILSVPLVFALAIAGSLVPASSICAATTPAASIAFVQSNYTVPQKAQTQVTVSFLSTQTAGDLNVVAIGWSDAVSSINSVTDTSGNVYARAAGPIAGSKRSAAIYYAKNIASSKANAVTVTFSAPVPFADVRILEYKGLDPVSPLDVAAAAAGSSSTANSGAITTHAASELIFGANDVATSTSSASSGFTKRVITSPDGNIAEDRVVTAAGMYSASAPLNGSGAWVMVMAAFKGASVTSPPPSQPVVSISAPAGGTTLSGKIVVTAQASDTGSSISSVQFQVDGAAVGAASGTGPYSISLDTSTLSNGSHALSAMAQDSAGNAATSAAVGVTVSNAVVTNPPPSSAMGPLVQSTTNSHFFINPVGQAVMLSGSHTWDDFQDTASTANPPAFDFDAYVAFLKSHGHNATILWKKDLPTYCNWPPGGTWTMTPFPWLRTGGASGTQVASDGLPIFDLTQFNTAYFTRLRARAVELQQNNIYAIVQLFDGLGLSISRCSIDGYPFSAGNNANGIDDSGGTNSMTMSSANSITNYQDAYVQKVIDTLNDLPNVLWEISEEAPDNSTWWQAHMISMIRTYEAGKPQQHPIGFPSLNVSAAIDSTLYNSDADWVAPSNRISPASSCGTGTPACKVNINDTDHSYFGIEGDTAQVNRNYIWENFTKGASVLFMDGYLINYPNMNPCGGTSVNGICNEVGTKWNNFRDNLGYTLTYANTKMDLINMVPNGSLSSTTFCLSKAVANGAEYFVYAPSGGSFTLDISATTSTLTVEWFNPATGVASSGGIVTGGAVRTFTPPFSGDAVLFLH
jgi:hypothetical protein